MTTRAQLRKAALALPQVEERGTRADAAFLVDDERFAAVDGPWAVLHLDQADADEVLRSYPTAEPLDEEGAPAGVRVRVADIDGMALNHWVRRAWTSRAPARVSADAESAATAEPGEVGDLPRSIGRPATRALAAAGITTLAQIAETTDDDLLDLHGVGPRAVTLLREAVAEVPGQHG
ncbi:hypothetical protein [Georgenia sp. Z1491]|uniref:hypothetical protein n=1 Tax=Georgenia sp. Z1491 TaxID=3416707 RepID=UPI003CFB8068